MKTVEKFKTKLHSLSYNSG